MPNGVQVWNTKLNYCAHGSGEDPNVLVLEPAGLQIPALLL
jgi:hypothetical protein